ncbi:unnamed protein product [Mortierella alpina]
MGYSPPGAECLRGVRFSADSRHILIWEENLLRVSIWSLESFSGDSSSSSSAAAASLSASRHHPSLQHGQHARVFAIQHPKAMSKSSVTSFSAPPLNALGTTSTSATGSGAQYVFSLRGDLQYLAIVERRECRDYVSVYATENYWTRPPVHTFGIADESDGGIKDAEGIAWSPDGRYLVVWENPLYEFKIAVYSLDGRCVGRYEVQPDFERPLQNGPRSFSSGGGGMGVKSVCWHPGSRLLALGGYDQKIRLLNHLTWKSILEFHHTAHINYGPKTVVWRESDSTVAVTGAVRVQGGIEYAMVDQPTWIPTLQIDTQKPNAKMGVGWCDFNSDGTLLASRNGMSPLGRGLQIIKHWPFLLELTHASRPV